MNISEKIRQDLLEMQDLKYKEFSQKLTPTIQPENVIGIRTPILRDYAKKLYKENDLTPFWDEIPHKYYEENNVHAFLIEQIKNYEECIRRLDQFLPYVDNWATCDMMSPKVFKKHKEELLCKIQEWVKAEEVYTVRFGVGALMTHFLDGDFEEKQFELVISIESQEYYINMMRAWYFATALAKQYDAALQVLLEKKLDVWTHNKAIQKACESHRVEKEQKEYLRTLKIR